MVEPVAAPADDTAHATLHGAVQNVHYGKHQGWESRIADGAAFTDPEQEVILLSAAGIRDVSDPFTDMLPSAAFKYLPRVRGNVSPGAVFFSGN